MNPLPFAALVAVHVAIVLAMPVLMIGLVNRTKSWWGGRRGPGLLQSGWDLLRLLRKRSVVSTVTTPLFRAGAWVVLAASVLAAQIAPVLGPFAPIAFAHDFIVLAYTLGLARLELRLRPAAHEAARAAQPGHGPLGPLAAEGEDPREVLRHEVPVPVETAGLDIDSAYILKSTLTEKLIVVTNRSIFSTL